MALTMTAVNPTTGEATNVAYAKVTNFYGTKDQIQVQVAVYATKEARENNLQTIKDNAHYIGVADLPANTDLMPAIYTVLKTMADYQGAVDA